MKHLVCLMALIGLGCLQMRAAEDQEVTPEIDRNQ